MATPLRIVLFDLDGTLVDSRRAIVDAVADGVEEVARALHLHDLRADRERIRDALGLPADAYFRRILPDTLLHAADRVKAAATRHEVQALKSGLGALYPETLAALQSLRADGFALGVVSNAQREYFRAALDCLDLTPLLGTSECYEELPRGVSAPFKTALVQRALARCAADPARSFVVGDRAEDLHAGRATGCGTVGVLHGFGNAEELREADHLAADLDAAAAWIRAQGAVSRR